MSWNLVLLLALLFGTGDPSFDPEVACMDARLASSPLCVGGPWAELLPGPAAVRARLLFAMALLHEALGDKAAADEARAAADEALELALTDRNYARGWLAEARATLDRSRARSPRAERDDVRLGGDFTDGTNPRAARDSLAEARDSLR